MDLSVCVPDVRGAGMNPFRRRAARLVKRAATVLLGYSVLAATLAPQALAQGCALCYQSAAAGGDRSRVALQHGILVLLIPSVGLFVGIFGLIYSRRNVSR
jgi:hypothetical protein